MAQILLISCNLREDPYPVYPLGMAMVGAALRRAGHEAVELDCRGAGNLVAAAKARAPDLVGLSLRNVDGQVEAYVRLVAELKAALDAPVVLGGSAFSLFPEALLARTGADCGVVGEGEEAMRQIADAFDKGVRPQGVVRAVVKDFAFAGRDNVLAERYWAEGGLLGVQTKRGCPHRCAYCSYPALEGEAYRHRDPVDVVDEIEFLYRELKADYFFFTDAVFNDADGRYLDVAAELVRRRLGVSWTAYFRPAKFTDVEVALLRDSGLKAAEWGTDAASAATARGLGKGFDWETVLDANARFAAAGVANAHFVIFGGPGEIAATVEEGLVNLERLGRAVVFATVGVRVYPGTRMRDIAVGEGLLDAGNDLLEPFEYVSPSIDREWLERRLLAAFAGRPEWVYPWGRDQDKLDALRRLGHRGPGWDLLLRRRSGSRSPA